VEGFPAIVANDIYGGDLFEQGKREYQRERK
jgi:tartrate dehydratase beta subunit/fumarate hydratase class I family protein